MTETWLMDGIFNAEFIDKRYTVYRCDRCSATSSKSRGGGVLIAVFKNLDSVQLDIDTGRREELWVNISCNDENLILCAIYLPPNSSPEVYNEHCSFLESISQEYADTRICVIGDFNLPNISWVPNEDCVGLSPVCSNDLREQMVSDYYMLCGFNQFNSCPNSIGSILDLVFCNFDTVTVNTTDPLLPCDVYHPALGISILNLESSPNCCNSPTDSLNFRKADYGDINSFFNSINWVCLCDFQCIDVCLNAFYDIVSTAFELFVPKYRPYFNTYPSWFDQKTKLLIKDKKLAHKKYKQTGCVNDYLNFCNLRRECKGAITKCKRSHIDNVEQNIQNDVKSFWSFVNTKRGKSSSLPKVLFHADKKADNLSDICNLFAEYFKSVYSHSDNPVNFPSGNTKACPSIDAQINELEISVEEITKGISNLDLNWSPGSDGIPPAFVKMCAFSLSFPLKIIFNKSLHLGIFPEAWKISDVVPIHKSGSKSQVNNYRGISILPALSKLFDSIVTDRLYSCIKGTIIKEQHGFMAGKSTKTNLTIFTDYLFKNVENGYAVDCIYTDIKKAFDRVNIQLLVNKLNNLGIRNPILSWINSYLTGRLQRVKISNNRSCFIEVTSGVPQGSHIDPLLFLVFINDVNSVFKHCRFLLFADDLKLFCRIRNSTDVILLQEDLGKFVEWCDSNKLELNIEKCKAIRFSSKKLLDPPTYFIKDRKLETTLSVNDLGVTFSSKLDFNIHIDNIANKANKLLGFLIRQGTIFYNLRTFIILYCSLVRSVLEYCTVIWSPYHLVKIQRLEKIQSRFIKFLCFKFNVDFKSNNYVNLLQFFGLALLESRRTYFDLYFMFKILNNMCNCTNLCSLFNFHVPARNVRNPILFDVPFHRTNYSSNSVVPRLSNLANKYRRDISLFNVSSFVFKRSVRIALKM